MKAVPPHLETNLLSSCCFSAFQPTAFLFLPFPSHPFPGTETTRTACTECSPGVACSGNSTQTPCGNGTFAAANSATCTACGYLNEFSGAGPAKKCSECPPGSYTDDGTGLLGKEHDEGGAIQGTNANPNWMMTMRTKCLICDQGFYCPGGGTTNRKICQDGYSAPVGSTKCSQVQECPPGR